MYRVQHASPNFPASKISQDAELKEETTDEQNHMPGSAETKITIESKIEKYRKFAPGVEEKRLSELAERSLLLTPEALNEERKNLGEKQTKINQYRNLVPAVKEELLPKLAERSLSVSIPEVRGLYHHRDPSLNDVPFFFSRYETEKTELDVIKDLPMKEQGWITRASRGEAATAAVAKYSGAYIKNLHAKVIASLDLSRTDNAVHIVRPSRSTYCNDYTLNFLTFATQTELACTLNDIEAKAAKEDGRKPIKFSDHKCFYCLNRTSDTEVSQIGRLVQQPYFVTSELNAGDKIIIADDHVQAGGSIVSMLSAAKEANIDVLAVAALSAHPLCAQFSLSDDVKSLLDKTMEKWDKSGLINKTLTEMGMPLHSLTNHEAMTLIAYATDPTDEDAVAAFAKVDKGLLDDSASVKEGEEGENSSLASVLSEAPRTPEEIVEELNLAGFEYRKVIKDTPVKDVHVLDWDDCIRDEKGMKYQLMHNALAISANEYKDKYPELQKISDAVFEHLHRGEYCEGMPKLCMTQEQFSEYAISHPEFSKKDMARDLINNISALMEISTDQEKEIRKDRKNKLFDAVFKEYTRQYQKLIRPAPSWGNSGKGIKLPYPNVTLALMPGAKEFLDKIRNANAKTILISNRGHSDLEKEVNKLQIAHYFDYVVGTRTVTLANTDSKKKAQQASNTEEHPDTTVVMSIRGKPRPGQLQESFDQLSIPSGVDVTLWGDTPKDVTQALGMKDIFENSNVRGNVINPGLHKEVEAARKEVEDSGLTLPINHIDKFPA